MKLTDRDEELDLAKTLQERTSNVSGLMEWVTTTDAKVLRSAPKSSDVNELNTELETYRVSIISFKIRSAHFQIHLTKL